MADDAHRAAAVRRIDIKRIAFPVSLFGQSNQMAVLLYDCRADDDIVAAQLDSAHTARRTSHHTGIRLLKADGFPLACGENHVVFSRRVLDKNKLVSVIQMNGDFAALSLILKIFDVRTLDDAMPCDHDKVLVFLKARNRNNGGNLLSLAHIDYIYDIGALRRPGSLGNLIGFFHINSARIGEQKQTTVGIRDDDVLDKILLLCGHADDALSAALLRGIRRGRRALDITRVRHRNHTFMPLNEVLVDDIVDCGGNLRASPVRKFLLDGEKLFLQNGLQLALVRENAFQLFN